MSELKVLGTIANDWCTFPLVLGVLLFDVPTSSDKEGNPLTSAILIADGQQCHNQRGVHSFGFLILLLLSWSSPSHRVWTKHGVSLAGQYHSASLYSLLHGGKALLSPLPVFWMLLAEWNKEQWMQCPQGWPLPCLSSKGKPQGKNIDPIWPCTNANNRSPVIE